MDTCDRLFAFLNAMDAPYTRLSHKPCRTSAECREVRGNAGYPDAVGAKALIIQLERLKEFAVVVLPGHLRLDNTAVRKLFGPFRFVTPGQADSLTGGLEFGTIPPFARPVLSGIDRLCVDERLLSSAEIGFNAASLEISLVMTASAYDRLPMAKSVVSVSRD